MHFEGAWGLFCGFFGFVFLSTSIPFPESYMMFWVFQWKTRAFQATKHDILSCPFSLVLQLHLFQQC